MLDDIRAALGRHLPRYDGAPVVPLGAGLDNIAYEVGGDLVLRRAREGTMAERLAAALHEADLLTAVAAVSSLPVPEPVFVDEPTAILAYRMLPGGPLHLNPVADPGALAEPLAAFLSGLHGAGSNQGDDGGSSPAALVEVDDTPAADWLADAAESYETAAVALEPADRARVEAFLAAAPPPAPKRLTFCHNDLGAEHVLVDGATITGVIDWSDAAVADPAVDLARLYRDLGPGVFEKIAAAYTGDVDAVNPGRVAFYARCALLEDIAYGLTSGATEYARLGLAHLDRTFA
ncbi:phosphotransferase family protein [Jiangella mangrovi]|uniref:Aminoglycoside phosphotransferase (APT) family kinase protein n=1 Tax=Jiangella mangrovi TaxID=1524084 RepID=A0A7W9GVJ0_9ACTN|nr:aminoglycoside phosphotransferase family protein [Jiangella mangrovi]MBB5790820.1 aminoglycoside phosphotransferase (APT) family kinase protein [Jiangella mangrovi]